MESSLLYSLHKEDIADAYQPSETHLSLDFSSQKSKWEPWMEIWMYIISFLKIFVLLKDVKEYELSI